MVAMDHSENPNAEPAQKTGSLFSLADPLRIPSGSPFIFEQIPRPYPWKIPTASPPKRPDPCFRWRIPEDPHWIPIHYTSWNV